MISDDGMGWMDVPPAAEEHDQHQRAYETAARAARLNLYNVVREAFDDHCRAEGLTRKELARRMGVAAAQVSRLLLRPTNMTIETAAKLMLAMGEEVTIRRRVRQDVQQAQPASTAVWHIPSSTVRIVGHAAVAFASGTRVTPLVANGVYNDGGPGLRTMKIVGSGGTADGLWEQVAASASSANPASSTLIREDAHG